VQRAYERHLVQGEATDELVELGQTGAALDILAQRNDWTRLWETAVRENIAPQLMARYVGIRTEGILKEVKQLNSTTTATSSSDSVTAQSLLHTAVSTMAQYGLPSVKEHIALYEGLVKAVLGVNQETDKRTATAAAAAQPQPKASSKTADNTATSATDVSTVTLLRQALFDLLQKTREATGGKRSGRLDALAHLFMAVHYTALLHECTAQAARTNNSDCQQLAVKMAVTLLRYCDVIPADKCFYAAGQLCRQCGEDSLAFVLLNRYVDITEAIDEGDASLIDNSDFADATNVPVIDNAILPSTHYISNESKREEVRDWVLGVCVDAKIEQQLPTEADARGTVYEGLFASDLPCCVVTGYPVQKQLIEVGTGTANVAKASKRDWNMYVRTFKRCPWTGKQQNPQY
jgi:intraflagellar transport protein 172